MRRQRRRATDTAPLPDSPQGVEGLTAPARNGVNAAIAQASADDTEDAATGVLQYTDADVLPTDWYWHPWIGRGIYTLLVGAPSAGKSTMLAHLCSRTERSIVLCGEEDVRRVALPRLLTAGVDLRGVRFVPALEGWLLPTCRSRLCDLVHRHRAQLVVIDPLDSYLGRDADENANLAVRRMLEALQLVAEDTQAAIVAIRHPGKAAGNLLAGSRAWRSHPRAILQLAISPDDDQRGVLSVVKPPFGVMSEPHWYSLHGLPGKPKRWQLESAAPIYAERESAEVADRQDRHKIDDAVELLTRLLAGDEEMDCRAIYSHAERYLLKERTVRYAAERLGVRKRYEGTREDTRVYWRLPPLTPAGGASQPACQTASLGFSGENSRLAERQSGGETPSQRPKRSRTRKPRAGTTNPAEEYHGTPASS